MLKNTLENFTSQAGCIKICSQKYYFSGIPSVDDMALLREQEINPGNEQLYSFRNSRGCKTKLRSKKVHFGYEKSLMQRNFQTS